MAPKKKPNKKGNDDWEADLGETVDPVSTVSASAQAAGSEHDEEVGENNLGPGVGGGLLAALKKNKSKKQRKGKVVEEDYLDGEDPSTANGDEDRAETNGLVHSGAIAPEDANAEDVFAVQPKKAKEGKEKQTKAVPKADENESGDEAGGLKSKKEKEREKKEREKQRKKEQV